MEVYIELAIIDNLIINGVILFLTSYSLKIKVTFWRLFLSAFVGMSFAVALPLLSLNNVSLISIKILLGIIMILVINKKLAVKEYILYYIVFLTFTFVLGGFCYFIENLFNSNKSGFYVPVSVVVLFMLLYAFLLTKAIKAFYKKRKIYSFIYDIKIRCNKKEVKTKAYFDSGNTLTENNLPVVIINVKMFNKLHNKKFHEVLVYKDYSELNEAHFVEFSTITKTEKILVFKPDYLYLCQSNECKKDILLAVSMKNFSKEFDVIMGNIF